MIGWRPGGAGRLALARLRARPGRWLPAAAVLGVAVALLGTLSAYGTLAADRAARQTLRAAFEPARTVRFTWSGGVPAEVDRRARAALARTTAASVTRTVQLLATRLGRRTVRLAAIAPLGRSVRLTAGRLPRTCTPTRCEVLQVGGVSAGRTLAGRGVRIAVVGSAVVRTPVPLGYIPRPATARASADRRAPVLIGADPGALDRVPGLRTVFRTQGWAAPLKVGNLRVWELGARRRAIARTIRDAALADRGLTAAAPAALLATAQARAAPVRRRLLASGAAGLGVLATVLLLAAGGLRAGLAAELARLRTAGALPAQRVALVVVECGIPAAAGLLTGAGAAVGVTAILGGGDAVGAGALLEHGLLRGPAVGAALVAAVGATALLVLGAVAGRRTARRVCELALVTAAAALVASLLDAGTRSGASTGAAWLPVPALLAAGLLLARVLPALLRTAGRRLPGAASGTIRLALLDLARRPAAAVLAITALASALAVAGFALGLRETLLVGEREQAAFRVPADVVVTASPTLARPLERRLPADYGRVPDVTRVDPVLRRGGEVVIGPDRTDTTVLAAPAAVLARLGVPRTARLHPVAPPAPQGGGGTGRAAATPGRTAAAARRRPAVAPGSPLLVRVHSRGDAADVAVVLRRADGATVLSALDPVRGDPDLRRGRVPPGPGPLRVTGLTFRKGQALAATDGHQATNDVEGAATTGGALTLGPLRDGAGRVLAATGGWGGHGAAARTPGSRVVRLQFDRDALGILRPAAAIDRRPLAVVTDPGTAADAGPGGRFELDVDGTPVPARVVGTARRAVTIAGGPFALADASALRDALDAVQPGRGTVDELWVTADGADPAATARALHAVGGGRIQTQAGERRRLAANPTARALRRTLAPAAIAALALALLGVLTAAGATLRDGAAAHADLEADGTGPSALRRLVATQLAAVVVTGVAAAAALTAALVPLIVPVARAGDPPAHPPLHTVLPSTLPALVAGAVVLLLLAALLPIRRAFRAAWPARVLSPEHR